MRFEEMNLIQPLLDAIKDQGYTTPTPIQEKAIQEVLSGRDVMGCAQTGTGKTAAFALPILQKLETDGRPEGGRKPPIRVLVLTPTRELAAQVGESFSVYGRHTRVTTAVVFGGVGQDPQVRALARGVDVLVATPGRLLDLMGQGYVRLGSVEVLVLDEADRMLDMGFIHDIERIVSAVPSDRQTLLFSATLPPDIRRLTRWLLEGPVYVSVAPPSTTLDLTEQSVYLVERADKVALLAHLLAEPNVTRVLVFSRTKHGADRIVRQLSRAGVRAEAIHGDKAQTNRERALESFKSGRTRVLVATDIASRGLDIDDVSHVVNFDLPDEPEAYVHRIGRTGRAGAAGTAFSFCSAAERPLLAAIERTIRRRIDITPEHPYRSPLAFLSEGDRGRAADPAGLPDGVSQRGQPSGRSKGRQSGAAAMMRKSSHSGPPGIWRRGPAGE